MTKTFTAAAIAAGLSVALASAPAAASAPPIIRRETPPQEERTGSFEGDAETGRRKAVAQAKELRLDGRGLFLQGLGMQALVARDVDAGKAAFRRLLAQNPDSDEGYLQLASAAELEDDPAEAARLYSEALVRRPDLAPFYRERRGKVLFEAGRWDLSLKDAEAGLASSPKDPDLLRLKAKCLINLGDAAAAAASYDASMTHGRRARTGEDDWICGRIAEAGTKSKACTR